MEYTLSFGERPGVTVETAGRATLDEFLLFMHELAADARFETGMPILLDHTALDPSELTSADVEAIAHAAVRLAGRFGDGPLAIVAPANLMFGLSRMYEAYAAESPLRVAVCRERAEAERWVELAISGVEPA